MNYELLLKFAVGAILVISAVFTIINDGAKRKVAKLENKIDEHEKAIGEHKKTIDKLINFAIRVISEEFVETKLYIMGPRNHGKSAIATALAHLWQSVDNLHSTPLKFEKFTWVSPVFKETTFLDESIDVNRVLRTQARLTIYDYAGEDSNIENALKAIKESERYMILFVFSCEKFMVQNSLSYFSIKSLRSMRSAINEAQKLPIKTFVVFSKNDVSEFAEHSDPENVPASLMEIYKNSIDNISTVFGEIKPIIVSSHTGFGTAILFRSLLGEIVDAKGLPLV